MVSELIKTMNFNEVAKVIRSSLALDDKVRITEESKLVELGAEPIDVLDIFYRLNIPYADYISGERINEKGKTRLDGIFNAKKNEKANSDTMHLQKLSGYKTTNEFINQLLVKDLLEIQSYEATH